MNQNECITNEFHDLRMIALKNVILNLKSIGLTNI